MQRFVQAQTIRDPAKEIELREHIMQTTGVSATEAQQIIDETAREPVWINDKYQVRIRDLGKTVHLSIKRIDRKPIHDWRDLQEIKNELVGPECEGLELYPAESRVIDTANQYHLYVYKDPTIRLPFGDFIDKPIRSEKETAGIKQRPFTKD